MTNSSILDRLAHGALLSDGAMGTQLYARGITAGPLELANVERPDDVRSVHLGYLSAGSEFIETNTFGANASRLAAYGMAHRVAELNRAGVALAREAAQADGRQAWVAGAMGPLAFEMLGLDAARSGARDIFAAHAAALAEAGADLLVLETFGSLAQLRLAVEAAKSASGLPIIAQLTFNGDGFTRDGDSPEDAAAAFTAEDVIAIGANCSIGPYEVRMTIERMAAVSDLPLAWQPNAGLPTYQEGRLRYTAAPAYFAEVAREAVAAGAVVLGGCCGTTPEHIADLRNAVRGVTPARARPAIREKASTPSKPAPLPPTNLAARLGRGEFVVTVELPPPRGFDIEPALEKLRRSAGRFDAVNVADSPLAQGRMSALATSSLVQWRMGVETVMHVAIRHRNLLALHSDLLGAHAFGVRNVFAVMGDAPRIGDYPSATAVSDITASGLIRLIAGFNQGVDASGRELDSPTSFFIGAALNLNAPDLDKELRMLERKVEAGAHFLLTQPVYDPETVERAQSILGGFPLPVIMGVLPLRSGGHARFLHNEAPGIVIPAGVMERMERAGNRGAEEGAAIARELLLAVSDRVAGAYFMPPFERYSIVAETLEGLALPSSSTPPE